MTPIGWTPEGTATWQVANRSLRDYIAETANPPCPWCCGQGGFFRKSEITAGHLFVLCEGCFGKGTWVSGDATP